MSVDIQPLAESHAEAVADLHRTGIATGFLSSLGPGFLRQLYIALPGCTAGFGFAAVDEDGQVRGFVACAENTGRLYKQALLRRGIPMAASLAKFLVKPKTLQRMWETLRYPAEVSADLPGAELLSIVVSDGARRQGLGKTLIEIALTEFSRRQVPRVKVAVWAGNDTANAVYSRCGFDLACTRDHHGLAMNIYVHEPS